MYSLIVFLSSLFGLIVCHSSDATIGNYSQYIPEYELCGLSMSFYQSSNKCFQFHQNMESPIRGGREVYDSEAPWVVDLEVDISYGWYKFWHWRNSPSYCTGTLISKQWVLTAAHCLFPGEKNELKVKVWFGPNYRRDEIPGTDKSNGIKVIAQVIHPLHSQDKQIDVALLQLAEPVPISQIDDNYLTNFICLPEKTNTLKRDLLSFNSGWGEVHSGRLKISSRIMIGQLYATSVNAMKEAVLYAQYETNGTGSPCPGDSGGPVWQYVYGRAVIIGVHKGAKGNDCTISKSIGIFVPKFIDWILKTIK